MTEKTKTDSEVKKAQDTWVNFTKATTYSVIISSVILALLVVIIV